MKKRLLAATLMLATFTGTAAALSSYTKNIPVEYGISLRINDQTPQLTDAAGKPVQPFVYDGTTYVPMRAVSENLGAKVSFDASTNTAHIVNDLPEILAVAHTLENTADECYLLLDSIIGDFRSEDFLDHSKWFAQIQQDIDYNWTLLEFMANENRHIGELTGDLLRTYTDFLISYEYARQSYNAYLQTKSNQHALDYADHYENAAAKYFELRDKVSALFARSGWRDLTNLT